MKVDVLGENGKMKSRAVRSIVFMVFVCSAWVGAWLCGMDKVWAIVLSAAGGLAAVFVGAVMAGVLYQDSHNKMEREMARLNQFSQETLGRLQLDLENIEKANKERRRQLCMASVVMAKVVSERVAGRLISRYTKNFPTPEHVESATREANEIVAEEIVSYSNELMVTKNS